jgi:acylphosphatase
MAEKHLNITVYGKVQGVWFRASTRDKAQDLGLNGYVMNQGDGTVYIEVEGTEDALKELLEWCKQGPPRAEVSKVEESPGEMSNFSGFEIIR